MKKDWRSRLKRIVSRAPGRRRPRGVPTEESRLHITLFIRDTVVPAFRELERELAKHDRTVHVDEGPYQASITVLHEGEEEFSYAVRGRVYHTMSFAFPEMGEDGGTVAHAEVVMRSGTEAYELTEFTREDIIQDFLDEYAKWMGW
ncbi:MAG: hypothetical protein ACQEXJ_19380 [Myxococcota bacterium]